MTSTCPLCGGGDVAVRYRGPIRTGRFGSLSEGEREVLRCDTCDVGWLAGGGAAEGYYESEAYREDVDGAASAEAFFEAHDREQLRHLAAVGLDGLRGLAVADVGCGAGSFLDAVRGMAARTVAIEPAAQYHDSLRARGHDVYPYCAEAGDEAGRVDVATCFSVIEHVGDPLALLEDMAPMLRGGGRVHVSTPNADDVLLDLLPEAYGSFFHRKVHLWYFGARGLARLMERAGFVDVEVRPFHRFSLSNLLTWLVERRPGGDVPWPVVTPAMDAVWRAELERTGRADYLFAVGRRA